MALYSDAVKGCAQEGADPLLKAMLVNKGRNSRPALADFQEHMVNP
jgi:hypothetical protein